MKVAADIAAYDHPEAYEALVRLVNGFGESRGEATVDDLASFVSRICRIDP